MLCVTSKEKKRRWRWAGFKKSSWLLQASVWLKPVCRAGIEVECCVYWGQALTDEYDTLCDAWLVETDVNSSGEWEQSKLCVVTIRAY